MVRERGLEPLRIAPPDPKSGASANFATPALITNGLHLYLKNLPKRCAYVALDRRGADLLGLISQCLNAKRVGSISQGGEHEGTPRAVAGSCVAGDTVCVAVHVLGRYRVVLNRSFSDE